MTHTLEGLASAIANTEGTQCATWKEALKRKLLDAADSYADALAATPLSSRQIMDARQALDYALTVVFTLIPHEKRVGA